MINRAVLGFPRFPTIFRQNHLRSPYPFDGSISYNLRIGWRGNKKEPLIFRISMGKTSMVSPVFWYISPSSKESRWNLGFSAEVDGNIVVPWWSWMSWHGFSGSMVSSWMSRLLKMLGEELEVGRTIADSLNDSDKSDWKRWSVNGFFFDFCYWDEKTNSICVCWGELPWIAEFFHFAPLCQLPWDYVVGGMVPGSVDPLIRHGRPEAVSWFLAPFGEL